MQTYYAYIRVSTQKQRVHGTSPEEQRAAIKAFAKRNNLAISEWFEERETAAKIGRAVFRKMIAALERGKAQGVIMHKIDRGACNLRDWVELGTLVDRGIEVRFANENLDLKSRGGRLAADIQAVVAANFIRNLRDEVRKGFYGRLKQGFYPRQAPKGYIDNGKEKAKTICPATGPLVRKAFELYATGNYSLNALRIELTRMGLRSKQGKPLHISRISYLLNNPFYYGLIHIKKANETFVGNHEPIIPKELFDRVQVLLHRKANVKAGVKQQYLLQRMVKCSVCDHGLYAERQKGIIYYRCHSKPCQGTSLREDAIMQRIVGDIDCMALSDAKIVALIEMFHVHIADLHSDQEAQEKSLLLAVAQIKDRMDRLTDAYLDQAIDRDTLEARKTALHNDLIVLEEKLEKLHSNDREYSDKEKNFLELVKRLKNLLELANLTETRDTLKSAISNLSVSRKDVDITWDSAFQLMVSEPILAYCVPKRNESRIIKEERNLQRVVCTVLACPNHNPTLPLLSQ